MLQYPKFLAADVVRAILINFLVLSCLILILVTVCFYWVDRPVAIWMSHHFTYDRHGPLDRIHAKALTQLCYFGLIISFLFYYVLRWHKHHTRWMRCLSLLSTSVVFAYFAKTNLQYLFGRYVPRYPDSNSLLFVRRHQLYGFHWFQSGCFPSGHMTVFTAAIVAISLFYPKFRFIGLAILLILTGLLIALNYHFVSDIVAGAYLGGCTTMAIYYLYSRLGRYEV